MKTAAIVFLAVFFFYTSASAADRIRIGIPSPAAQFVTFPLAQKKGFFKEEGLEAEIIQMRGNVPMAALVNGDIDYYTVVGSGAEGPLPKQFVEFFLILVVVLSEPWGNREKLEISRLHLGVDARSGWRSTHG